MPPRIDLGVSPRWVNMEIWESLQTRLHHGDTVLTGGFDNEKSHLFQKGDPRSGTGSLPLRL